MKKACTKKVLTSRASTSAMTSRSGSSRSSEPFFFSLPRPRRPLPSAAADPSADSEEAAAEVAGCGWSLRPSSPGTTSAGLPGRSLLIASQRTARGTRRSTSRPRAAGVVSARDGLALLLDLGGLAAQLAEVVELGAAHVAARHDLDLLHDRGVHREGALDTDAEADLADGEGLADPAALAPDDDALEDLDAGAVALDHADVDLDGVTRPERGDVRPQRVGVESVQGVHRGSPQFWLGSFGCGSFWPGQRCSPAVRSGGLRSGRGAAVSTRRRPAAALYCATSSADDAGWPRPWPREQ